MSGFDFVEEAMFGKSIFKNESTLYPEYVPPELPRREEEIPGTIDLKIAVRPVVMGFHQE